MDVQEQALFFFRKLAYVLYLEIGALQPRVHAEIARKARLNSAFFQREKSRMALEMYQMSEVEKDPNRILAPYIDRTGLALEDVHRAFAEGDWKNKYGGFNFGGPRWEKIAASALALRDVIYKQDWEQAELLIHEIKGMRTNQGYLVSAFDRTERPRK